MAWVVSAAVSGLLVQVVIYLCTGWVVGSIVVLIPVIVVMALIHHETTGRTLIDEYRADREEAEIKAQEHLEAYYPDDLVLLRTFVGVDNQIMYNELILALDRAGIRSWNKTGGVTNVFVQEDCFAQADHIATEMGV